MHDILSVALPPPILLDSDWAVEIKTTVWIVLLLHVPQLLQSPWLEAVQFFQRLVSKGIVKVGVPLFHPTPLENDVTYLTTGGNYDVVKAGVLEIREDGRPEDCQLFVKPTQPDVQSGETNE